MKILFVQKMAGISGSELYLMNLLPELRRRDYNVQVAIIFSTIPEKVKPFTDYCRQNCIVTHEIYGHGDLSPILMMKLRKLLRNEKFDIVQSNLAHADLWMAVQKALFFPRMNLISVKHGFDESYSAKYGNDQRHLKKSRFYWVQKMSGWFADYNVTVSKGLYDMYAKGGIVPTGKIGNIYYGLSLADKEKQVVEREPAEKYALILGRLVKYKGHELLLKTWKKVARHKQNWKLYIVGSGNYERNLLQLKEELELGDSVKFCGYQENPHQFIKDAQFMLVTSIWEGFGLIMLESWAHKKPILAFDVPAMNEAIEDNINGLLVKDFDINDLYEKIIYYFRHTEITKKHGVSGYERLNSYYTVTRMADEMCEVYKQIYRASA